MRFEVPQFIEIEDKIIGPLTWKQFVYLAGGGGILLVLFLSAPTIVVALIGIPIAALTFSLAFHRINNRPFSIFLESFVSYFSKSRLYLWKKEKQQVVIYKTEATEKTAPALEFTQKSSLASLAHKLEHHIHDLNV